jgi:hypothetical protein
LSTKPLSTAFSACSSARRDGNPSGTYGTGPGDAAADPRLQCNHLQCG